MNIMPLKQPMKVIPSLEDKLILKENKVVGVSVKFMYSVLNQSPSIPFPLQLIWDPMSHKRWVFFFLLGIRF